MKISSFQNYKIANKILAGMLAMTITVGITPSFSFANSSSNRMGTVKMSILDIEGPQILWKYKNSEENCIYVGLHDDAKLDKILDENEKERVTFEEEPTDVVARYQLEGNDEVEFTIQNKAKKKTLVTIADVSLNVLKAYKNENGDVIALDLEDVQNGISKVTYLGGTEIPEITQSIENGKKHSMKSYRIKEGTVAVRVYQGDGQKYAIVGLSLDWRAPEIQRAYRNRANTKMIIRAMDNDSGIEKILLDGDRMEIEAYSNEVFERLSQGVTKIEVYDAVGHVTKYDALVDSTEPVTRIAKALDENGQVIEGKYIARLKAPKSGLWKITTEDNAIVGDPYLTYPQEEQIVTLEDITGVAKFKVYDAVGNVAIINIANVRCTIVYANNNEDGNRIAVNLFDDREIDKLAIVNDAKKESVIEVFEGVYTIRKWYETPKGTTKIRVYYTDPQYDYAEFVLDNYTEVPTKIENRVYSLVGIRKVQYDDGRIVEFREDMPTRVQVDLTRCDKATVYDSLDNMVEVTREG